MHMCPSYAIAWPTFPRKIGGRRRTTQRHMMLPKAEHSCQEANDGPAFMLWGRRVIGTPGPVSARPEKGGEGREKLSLHFIQNQTSGRTECPQTMIAYQMVNQKCKQRGGRANQRQGVIQSQAKRKQK